MKNLLEGLLSPADLKKTTTNKPPKRPTPKWRPTHLIILSLSTVCKNCARETLTTNPHLLLREISPTGAIRETAKPPSGSASLSSLPIEHQTIPFNETPFCTDCLPTIPHERLFNFFLTQRAPALQETALAPQETTDQQAEKLATLINNIQSN